MVCMRDAREAPHCILGHQPICGVEGRERNRSATIAPLALRSEVQLAHVALAGGADGKQRTIVATRVVESAERLGVQLDERVMLVEHHGIPGLRDKTHETFFGGGGVSAWDDAEALDDAEVVGVD